MKIFNVILGVYAVFNSLYCIFWPEESVLGIGWIIAIFLALWGISSIAEYSFSKKSVKGLKVGGSAGLVLGIAAMAVSILSLSSVLLYGAFSIIIIICLALGILTNGILELADNKKASGSGREKGWTTVSAIFKMIAGVFGVCSIVFLSENAPLAVGIMLLIIGVAELGSVFGTDAASEQSEIW